MCWNIAVLFRQQKRRKVQYEVCKLYPDTSLEEPSRRTDDDGGRIVVRFKYEQSIQDTVKALQTG